MPNWNDHAAAAIDSSSLCREIFQGDATMWIGYMQRQLGYALTGLVGEEALFFWFGRGANGKSVLVNIIYRCPRELLMGNMCHRTHSAPGEKQREMPNERR